jgi:hypothetical protein
MPVQPSCTPGDFTSPPYDGMVSSMGESKTETLAGVLVASSCASRRPVCGANTDILVTTSQYGPDAHQFAQNKPLKLITGAQLLGLLERHGYSIPH